VQTEIASQSLPISGALRDQRDRTSVRSKRLAFRVVSIAAGLIAALLLVEIVLRIAGWPAPGFYVNGSGPIELRQPGREGGAFPSSIRGELRHYDYSVECLTNRYGFRDRELVPKREGEWRIGILGDSFTAGVGVKQQERFADVFAAAIQKTRPNVTVWNLGAPFCGTACELEMLQYVKESYQLDEIVLAFSSMNDLEDNSAWHEGQRPASTNQHTFASRIKNWVREHSRVATFAWVTGLRAWASFRPPGIYRKSDLDKHWPATERALDNLQQTAGAKRLSVLYLPSTPEWDDSVWQLMRSRYDAEDNGRYLVRDAVAEWSRKAGIPFFDANAWLRKCAPPSQCVLPVDPHWNARGHALVAAGLGSQEQWSKVGK
jgi:hypothetical protein